MAQKSLDIDYITLRKIRAVNHTNNTNPTKNYILATNGRGDCDWTNTIENIATYGAYLGSAFMVVGGSGTNPLAYDRDGIHWYGSSNGANLFYNGQALCGAWNGVVWVVGGQSFDPSGGPTLVYSSDGITWSDNSGADLVFDIGGQCNAVAWDGQKWLAGGSKSNLIAGNAMRLLQSSDGITWSQVTTSSFHSAETCTALAWNGSVWLMGTNRGNIWSSLDGITWTLVAALFPTICTSIAWNGRLWVVAGDSITNSATIFTGSIYGTSWSGSVSALTIFPNQCNSVAWNGSLWVAAGDSDGSEGSSTLAYSQDGQVWTPSVNGLTLFPATCNSVIWNGYVWVAGGVGVPGGQPLAYSSDGMTWFPSISETSQLSVVNFVASSQVLPYIGINKTGPILHQELGPGGRVVYDASGQNLYISRILTVQEPSAESGTGSVTVTGNVLPKTTNTHSLGSPSLKWKDLYVGESSIHIGNTGIINANNNGAIGINYSDPSSNPLISLEVGNASFFHDSIGINTAPFTSFTVAGQPIPALLIEGLTQLGVTEPQFMSVYNNNNQVNGYIYGDVSDGSISIGYNYQNAKPILSAQGTTVPTLGTSQIKMLEDTVVAYIDASQNNVNSPGTVGWSIIGNGIGNPASVGIGTEDPSPLYALDVAGASHVSNYMVVDGSLNSFSISTGAISSTTVYASTSATINGQLNALNISTGAISSSTVYASTSATVNGQLDALNISTGAISSSTVYASTSATINGQLNALNISTGAISSSTVYATTSVTAGNVSVNTLGLTTSQGAMRLGTTNLSGSETSITFDYTGFYPNSDNVLSLGFGQNRWSNLYVNNFNTTSLNTSQLNYNDPINTRSPLTPFTTNGRNPEQVYSISYSQFTGSITINLIGAGAGGGAGGNVDGTIFGGAGGGGGGSGGSLQLTATVVTPTDIAFYIHLGTPGVGGAAQGSGCCGLPGTAPSSPTYVTITINGIQYTYSDNYPRWGDGGGNDTDYGFGGTGGGQFTDGGAPIVSITYNLGGTAGQPGSVAGSATNGGAGGGSGFGAGGAGGNGAVYGSQLATNGSRGSDPYFSFQLVSGIGPTPNPWQYVLPNRTYIYNLTAVNITATNKSFVIPHPDPAKNSTHKLRHCCVEAPTRGDNLYRWILATTNKTCVQSLANYSKFLNENWQFLVSPVKSFGSGYVELSDDESSFTLTVSEDGMYSVIGIGTRKDEHAKTFDTYGVEYENTQE